ncbi:MULTISPECIES: PQQ-binding-like beta-propeller repeat protein [unclassified Mycolicibacterium]|uniref:outer membrane protein assembly factor BamB family protein n=1 Tax=unclassified Mycolicibacterium TaxID=2636767 RepID=UPI0012DBD92F|nr:MULTISPECIES: PQQ-binding-like beta-propeller repeat protein [unclassified Mycolicibacterium]MUL81131.1 PQQ-binding-like beta-propeller repeat protein [Mycolicibacterium sp. CBMA 329]MUL86897.1 PQQ-binding-like beta-propeller repeat protein [Mycolicibacterium sp. CBMA 331]MUL98819.1 PQQ-binding-like beta-propeller repeat protein [Mycolicibacterium sp. CBMA 334]MUM30134.1 PQQ-binding-like beta-propeller repeat protein [Mycolicibacterium sp. CBMA 295]MUM37194.1 PQQ-binding-like beta-propeller
MVVVLALVVGSVVVWKLNSGGSGSDIDTSAGKAEVAREERPPVAAKAPPLGSAPTKKLWTYPPGGDARGYPTVMGGDSKTVIVNMGDSLVALDAANGSERWRQPAPASIGSYGYCVVSTSGKAGLCSGGQNAVLLDMTTGATKDTMAAQGFGSVYSGSGLLAFVDVRKSVTVFDDAGQQLWTKSTPGMVSVFLDQRIIAEAPGTSTSFYDAKTGDEQFSIGAVDDIVATSRGVAVSVRGSSLVSGERFPKQRIDFYSFTGKLAWSIPEDQGYRLPNTAPISGIPSPSSVEFATSGVVLPIVYSEDKGEIAAVDPLTGEFKWSQQTPIPPHTVVYLSGIGNLCKVSYSEVGTGAGGVRVRDCNDGTGAFIAKSELSTLVAADGDQIVGTGDSSYVSAYDTATGRQSGRLDDHIGVVTWVGDGLYAAGSGKVTRLS